MLRFGSWNITVIMYFVFVPKEIEIWLLMLFGVIPPTAQDYNYMPIRNTAKNLISEKMMTALTVLFLILTQISVWM